MKTFIFIVLVTLGLLPSYGHDVVNTGATAKVEILTPVSLPQPKRPPLTFERGQIFKVVLVHCLDTSHHSLIFTGQSTDENLPMLFLGACEMMGTDIITDESQIEFYGRYYPVRLRISLDNPPTNIPDTHWQQMLKASKID